MTTCNMVSRGTKFIYILHRRALVSSLGISHSGISYLQERWYSDPAVSTDIRTVVEIFEAVFADVSS